jgi:LmbE family N-acetylglucosaminyl deacetylase
MVSEPMPEGAETLTVDQIRPPILVIAPHPDDESIGCGGLIARARCRAAAVFVVFVTDGSGSHPHSAAYPAARLAVLREREAIDALSILRVPLERITFWRLPDRAVPEAGSPGFAEAVARARRQLREIVPRTLVLPDRNDAHGDHRAAWAIWSQALAEEGTVAQLIEYPVWPGTAPALPPGRRLVLDIALVLSSKSRAIATHRSQHGQVVTDDPTGFRLPADLLERASRPWEVFFEAAR